MKRLIIFIFLFISAFSGFAQEEETEVTPIRNDWGSTQLIDNQTTFNPDAKKLELIIQHRFGEFENGLTDLFGIYAPSNIRMGFNYGITDDIMVAVGTEKNNKMQDIQVKWTPLRQTNTNSIPVTVSAFGIMGIDARAEDVFGTEYAFTNRLSYFGQVIVSKNFNERISVMLAPSFSHFNVVDSLYDHDRIGLTFGTRVKIVGKLFATLEYDHPFYFDSMKEFIRTDEQNDKINSKPNLAFGIEKNSRTHSFQIFLATCDKITPQKNFHYNLKDIAEGDFILGFNICVKFK